MSENVGLTIKQKKFDELSTLFVQDLTAFYNLLNEDVNKLVVKSEKENWTPLQLIKKIEDLI